MPETTKNLKKNNTSGTKSTTVFAVVILALSIAAIIIAFNWRGITGGGSDDSTHMLQSGIVSSNIQDSSGKTHIVEARVSLEIDSDSGEDIDKEDLEDAMRSTLGLLDFDSLTARGGLDYVKRQLMQSLEASSVNSEAISGIYITDFARGFRIPEGRANTNDRLNGIFGRWK